MKTIYAYRSNLRPGWAESSFYSSQNKCFDMMVIEAQAVLQQLLDIEDNGNFVRVRNPDTPEVVVEIVELKDNELYVVEAWTMYTRILIGE